jgi:hypothetical protein
MHKQDSKSIYYSNQTETPDLRKIPGETYREYLVDMIAMALDPIENFAYLVGDDLNGKTQQEKEMISILHALCKNAKATLTRFDDDLTRHAGEIAILRYRYKNKTGEEPEKMAGVEIRQTTKDKEVAA